MLKAELHRFWMKSALDHCGVPWNWRWSRSYGCGLVLAVLLCAFSAFSQTCLTAEDMDAASRSALQPVASRYFDMVARGDAASLKQNSISSVANDFAAIENTIKENQADLAGAQAASPLPFLLKAKRTAPL